MNTNMLVAGVEFVVAFYVAMLVAQKVKAR
jgi:hypothetical protein